MFIALIIQHAMRMHRIVSCGLFGPTVFFHFISLRGYKKDDFIGLKLQISLSFFLSFIRARAYARMHCSLQAYCATLLHVLDVLTFAARFPHVTHDARNPSSGRRNSWARNVR
jgi:hypothetical protein